MSDLVLNALRRNREIAEKAGQSTRVERIDARLAGPPRPERSANKKAEVAEVEEVEVDATDAAVSLAAEHGIDLFGIIGTGEGGRILKSDVEALTGDDGA